MSRAIGIAETGDRYGGDFDLAARRWQRCGPGVAAEFADHTPIGRERRQNQLAVRPEIVEPRRIDAALRQCAARPFVDVLQPLPGRAALGERLGETETLRQSGENGV